MGFDQAENRNQQRAQPDEEELQHFVEDGGIQSAGRDVDADGERGNPDTEMDVPAEDHFHHHGHRVHKLTPDIRMVIAAKLMALSPLAAGPKRRFK